MWPNLSLLLLFFCYYHHAFADHLLRPPHDNPSLSLQDDYSCSAATSGYCGYGPTYCGAGCVSNCNAVAECGKFANPAGKRCPLNTCCSEYDFCGTTEEFCKKGCQSNCVLHPKPPGGSTTGKALSKVIGYYEAWSDRSRCHQTSPSDLPLNALTHINYAFAYIDPDSFAITTMDAATPARTLDDISALKITNPSLKIFVSIGGWTFSDNNTYTQPIFGNIASTAGNRDKFASQLLAFMNQYGFDGVDLDWEYPGAPDRGGKPRDKANYVHLLEKIRTRFNRSGRDLGLTFTAPSSYWYMRWFDLPGMLKYADWMNLMSYDLHGVWDRDNPIGSVLHAHTNLTEIKLATELLWHVHVKPHQVALGFGFYGRSFKLSDPSCTSIGCPFSGGAHPGICTNTSGYLAYYEIKQILARNRAINVVHDKEAAVKYFTWNTDQWIAYDDRDTFKQKLEWANSVGFSGSLIWASDLDSYDFDAHKALTGKTDLSNRPGRVPDLAAEAAMAEELDMDLGGKCYKFEDSVDLRNPVASSCAPYVRMGYDKAGCDECGKPVCCGSHSGLGACQWRGGSGGKWSDCNGQCHAGEVKIASSEYGDGMTKGCGEGYEELAQSYCCPRSSAMPLENCHWVGKGDCADNTCSPTEVTLATDTVGGSYEGCNWNRKKALCCTPKADVLQKLDCTVDICDILSGDCNDEAGIPNEAFYQVQDGQSMWEYDDFPWMETEEWHALSAAREMFVRVNRVLGSAIHHYKDLKLMTRPYNSGLSLLTGSGASTLNIKGGFSMASDVCSNTAMQFIKAADMAKATARFLETAISGVLPSGNAIKAAKIDPKILLDTWNKVYSVSLPRIGALITDAEWKPPITPNDRVFEVLGSQAYRSAMTLVPKSLNLLKKDIFALNNPIADGDEKSAKSLGSSLQMTFGVFNYLNHNLIRSNLDQGRDMLLQEWRNYENHMGVKGIVAIWQEFEADFYAELVRKASSFIQRSLLQIDFRLNVQGFDNTAVSEMIFTAVQLRKQLDLIRFPMK
ncbi:uncharacterized protein BDV14DRAFT_194358 [Aspergillus stella-maris]|uniref:uncharacterized protein n=1 Tax=Aspergillus stella-maris TaxID=1810926 RepID=UPI003CCC9CE2